MRRRGFSGRVHLVTLVSSLVTACSATAPDGRQTQKTVPHAVTAPRASTPDVSHLVDGWALERRVSTDLNRDARDDAVLLFQRTADGGLHERMLAIALQNGSGDYELAESNARIIPSSGEPGQEDPMADGELAPNPQGFHLSFKLFSSMGSYLTVAVRYGFQFQQACTGLVAYSWLETHRATLDIDELEADFTAQSYTRRLGNAESGEMNEERGKLRDAPSHCLRDLPDVSSFHEAVLGAL